MISTRALFIVLSVSMLLCSGLGMHLQAQLPGVTKSACFGQCQHKGFDFVQNSNTPNDVRSITLRTGDILDGIKLGYKGSSTAYVGSQGGAEYSWTVPEGEYITDVYFSIGNFIETIRFGTDYGNESPKFGGGVSLKPQQQYSVEYGRKLVGMRVYIENFVRGIQFYEKQLAQ